MTGARAVPLLLLAGLLAYANAGRKAFVFDDNMWILRNPDVGRFDIDWTVGRPLVNFTLAVNHALGGLHPVGYHLFNIGVHLLAGLTLYGLVRRTLKLPRLDGRYAGSADRLAFAAALLWLLHPLNTQAVTYVIQRCESLMGLFYLLGLYAWLRGATADRRAWAWYALTPIFLLLSGLCKEVAATLPPVLLLYDRVFLAGSWRELVRRRWAAYLAVAAAAAWVVRGVLGVATASEANSGGAGFNVQTVTPWQYLLTQSEVLLHYLRLTVLPVGQSLDYRDWPFARSVAEVWPAGLAVVGLLLATGLLLWVRPAVGFLGAWFFLILAPTSSVVPIIDAVFEHRMYLPLAGLLVGLVLAADALGRRLAVSPRTGLLLLVGTAAALGWLTHRRNAVYASQEAMWLDVADKRPRAAKPKAAVAEQLMQRGNFEQADVWLARAEAIRPNESMVIFIRGYYHDQLGEYEKAARSYRPVTDIHSGYVSRTAFEMFGRMRLAEGKPADAAELFRRGIERADTAAELWFLLAASELAAGRPAEAATAWDRAKALNPDIDRAFLHENRIRLLAEPANDRPARRPIPAAALICRMHPAPDAVAFDVFAISLAKDGQFAEAEQAARRGVQAAVAANDPALATALAERADMYKSGKPYLPRMPGKREK